MRAKKPLIWQAVWMWAKPIRVVGQIGNLSALASEPSYRAHFACAQDLFMQIANLHYVNYSASLLIEIFFGTISPQSDIHSLNANKVNRLPTRFFAGQFRFRKCERF